jgi:hypothetical protein
MEGALRSGETLADDFGIFANKNGHIFEHSKPVEFDRTFIMCSAANSKPFWFYHNF